MRHCTAGALALLGLGMTQMATAGFDGPAPLAWRWSPTSNAVPFGSPVVTDYGVFTAIGTRVYGIDRESGNSLWNFPQSEPLKSPVATPLGRVGKYLLVGLQDGTLVCIDSTNGQQVWRKTLESKIAGNIVAVGDLAVFGNQLNEIVTLKASDGSPYSSTKYVAPGLLNPTLVATSDSVIFVADQDVVSLDVRAGRTKWTKRFAFVSGPINVVDDRVFVNSGTFLSVLRSGTGSRIWETNTGDQLMGTPAASGEYSVTVSQMGDLFVFNTMGRPVFKKPVSVGAPVAFAPVINGNVAIVTTTAGTITMVDLRSGDITWNTGIPQAIKRAPGAQPAANPRGGQPNNQNRNNANTPQYVSSAGAPVLSGDTLYLLARDGTMLAYDRTMGVDLTPPEVAMAWPNPGDIVSGRAPMELIFRLEDDGVGIVPDSVKTTINGLPYIGTFTDAGWLGIKISNGEKNSPIADGRATIIVSATDWLGNLVEKRFTLTIDNSLPPLGGPKRNPGRPGGRPGGAPGGAPGSGSRGGGPDGLDG